MASKRAAQKKGSANNEVDRTQDVRSGPPVCGIVMPLSLIDSCPEDHWSDVREILNEAIESAGFEPQLVSHADDVGIIQKRIIQNLYENPIVVCDVSAKNPNVMFELGLRLAFDRPTVIVKDDKTAYSFDTAPIEHLEYPRDLRFGRIVEFKEALAEKLRGTHQKATEDPNYTTFLKHFGAFTVAKLDTKTVSTENFILEEVQNLRQMVARMGAKSVISTSTSTEPRRKALCFRGPEIDRDNIVAVLNPLFPGDVEFIKVSGTGHIHVALPDLDGAGIKELLRAARTITKDARVLPVPR